MFATTSELTTASELLDHMRRVSVEELLLVLLIQLVLIVSVARLFALLFRYIGQPSAVGEIVAGLILGPSLLGWLAPDVFQAIFRPSIGELPPVASDLLVSRVLTALAQIGLVLLLFLIGMEFDFAHLRWHGRTALSVSLTGIFAPFALGAILAWYIHPIVAGETPFVPFLLFMGTAMSITALPILGRMMVEMGISRTRLAALTICSGAVDDAAGWILLAAVAGVTRAAFNPWNTAGMIAATVGFGLFMIFLARPLLLRLTAQALRQGNGEIGVNTLAAVLVMLFLCSIVTNVIGIFAIFGAFLFGAILSEDAAFRAAVNRRLSDFVTSFFLPIFFAYTGLRTNIGSLETWQLGLIAVLVSLTAIVGKFGGCMLAAWLSGLKPREAGCIGVLMNTRALMELIVINVGRDLGVISESLYCMLVLMALLTTFMTTPILLWLMPGTELEEPIRKSGFLHPSWSAVLTSTNSPSDAGVAGILDAAEQEESSR